MKLIDNIKEEELEKEHKEDDNRDEQVKDLLEGVNFEESEEKKVEMNESQVKDLLDGIDFDEAIECCHTPDNEFVKKKQEMSTEEFKALLDGIDFEEPMECDSSKEIVPESPVKEVPVTPILAAFSSNEEKAPMCHTISSTSIASSEPFDVSGSASFNLSFDLDETKVTILISFF